MYALRIIIAMLPDGPICWSKFKATDYLESYTDA